MKSRVITLLLLILTGFGCDEQKPSSETEIINVSKVKKLSGKVIQKGDGQDFYDIQYGKDHYAVLNYYSDTLLYIFDLKSNQLQMQAGRQADDNLPHLIKKEANDKNPSFSFMNNKSGIVYSYTPEKENSFTEKAQSLSAMMGEYIYTTTFSDAVIDKKNLYAVLLHPPYVSTFHAFRPGKGSVMGEPVRSIARTLPQQTLAYTSYLTVNNKAEKVVTATRLTNSIHLYDLDGKLIKHIQLGNNIISPKPDSSRKFIDISNSIKCFFAVDSNKDYIYCLYSGNPDLETAASQVIVLNWKGKYIRTLELDRPITAFSVDKSGKYLLGIERTATGTDVVSFRL